MESCRAQPQRTKVGRTAVGNSSNEKLAEAGTDQARDNEYAFSANGTTRLERTSRGQPSERGSPQDALLVSLSPSEWLSDVTVRKL